MFLFAVFTKNYSDHKRRAEIAIQSFFEGSYELVFRSEAPSFLYYYHKNQSIFRPLHFAVARFLPLLKHIWQQLIPKY